MDFHPAQLQEVETWSGFPFYLWGHRVNASLCLPAPWDVTLLSSKRHLASVKHMALLPTARAGPLLWPQ